ncbi:MAG: DUF1080 domain-containing protein [Gammaproteobacteria bacterium]|nr:DUF1080 domain-containing protein [Gammaproteobacteria bacterium]
MYDDRRRVRSRSGRLPESSGIFVFPGALLLAFLLAWPAAGRPEPETATNEPADLGEISLFDGKSLDGWSGDSRYWSVIDGAITGRTDIPLKENTYLIREGTFSDFEARLKYRFLTEIGNSGLQYRGRRIEGRPFVVRGYQANIVTTHADRTFAMLWEDEARELLALYGETVEIFAAADPSAETFERRVTGTVNSKAEIMAQARHHPEWNEQIVIAYGNRLIHALNGMVTLEAIDNDEASRSLKGAFSLQIHRDMAMAVQFKDITVRELKTEPDIGGRFIRRHTPRHADSSGALP